jgi:uncharacterized protein (DUF1015 family)
MQIFAFQGFRYSDRVGDPGTMAAPPFDQIDERLRDELRARSPYHFTHFTKPVPRGLDDAYEAAAFQHAKWIEEGVVVREREPALYPYVIETAGEERRLGLCCCIDVGTPESSMLRPHEETVDKPLADRLSLLRETHVDPEPVMLLADDEGALDRLLAEDVDRLEPLARHVDGDGRAHVLFALRDPSRIETYKEVVAGRAATIADGHHRTKTAQLYAREVGAREGSATATKMAVLISLQSRALRIDPLHRGLSTPLAVMSMQGGVASRTTLSPRDGHELAAAVAAADQPAVGVWVRGGSPELWCLDPEKAPADTPERARSLPVVLLHYMLLPSAGIEHNAAVDGTIVYRSDAGDLFDSIDRGDLATGIWLPPMEPADFAEAVSTGDVLPPKSTRFLPKLISGLVWVGHDAALL